MSTAIPRCEQGTTKEFSVTYSSAPSATPQLALYAGSGTGTLVQSITASTSSTLAYYAYITLPGSPQLLAYTWTASFTAGPVVDRGHVQVIRTIAG